MRRSQQRQRHRSTHLSLATALSLVTIGLMALLPAQAAVATGTIQLSNNGVTFGPTYPGVLFDGIAHFVPGDTQPQVFYLRNDGPDSGYLRITLRDATGTPALIQGLSISGSVPGKPGAAVGLIQGAPCWVLNEGILVSAGSTIAVTAKLSFDPAAENTTQSSAANFNLGVSLTDTAVALPPTDCGGASTVIPGVVPKPGALSHTGTEVPVMLISVTAFITGAGLFLVVAARRRKKEHDGKALSR